MILNNIYIIVPPLALTESVSNHKFIATKCFLEQDSVMVMNILCSFFFPHPQKRSIPYSCINTIMYSISVDMLEWYFKKNSLNFLGPPFLSIAHLQQNQTSMQEGPLIQTGQLAHLDHGLSEAFLFMYLFILFSDAKFHLSMFNKQKCKGQTL